MLEFIAIFYGILLLERLYNKYILKVEPVRKTTRADVQHSDVGANGKSYDFKSIDDCADFIERRATRWHGDARKYYREVNEDIPM